MSNLKPEHELANAQLKLQTRRHFLGGCGVGLGAVALSQLLGESAVGRTADSNSDNESKGFLSNYGKPAKHVIYLHMAGSPPQQDLLDYKPELEKHHLKDCPDELIAGKEFAFIKGKPKLMGPVFGFKKFGQCGRMMGEKMPRLGAMADELCVINSMRTDQFNHAPAQLALHTGTPQFGGASFGSWATYGLGSENENLPGFMVMVSGGKLPSSGKSIWGNGYLPGVFQGVQCRNGGDPILYVSNPDGMSRDLRRESLNALNQLNEMSFQQYRSAETKTRIEQYELAFRMQTAVPEVMDISRESKETLESYGAVPGASSFANNCLLARRLVEQGVRFVQLFDWGWDIHGTGKHDDMKVQFVNKCNEADGPIAALIADLKQRGMLDETLVIWGGEFGRTPMIEARNGTHDYLGRDHHPDCFSMWVAGGGFKGGLTYGNSDELGFGVAEKPVDIKDLQATLLHAMGLNPYKLSFPYQGLNSRFIGPANTPVIVDELLV
jgi:hypothetical protein